MSRHSQQARIPGETGVLNNTNEDPNEIARKRERALRAIAQAQNEGDGDIAPPPDLDDGPAMPTTATIEGQTVRVRIPAIRRDDESRKYGPESRLPKGTPVRKDGTPCEGDEHPYGIVGDIELPGKGWLVNRVIPIEG